MSTDQAARRRSLYERDPLWRLSKLKQNREDRARRRLRTAQQVEADDAG